MQALGEVETFQFAQLSDETIRRQIRLREGRAALRTPLLQPGAGDVSEQRTAGAREHAFEIMDHLLAGDCHDRSD